MHAVVDAVTFGEFVGEVDPVLVALEDLERVLVRAGVALLLPLPLQLDAADSVTLSDAVNEAVDDESGERECVDDADGLEEDEVDAPELRDF